MTFGRGVGGAVDALNIAQGLQRGGVSGYGSAAVNAGKLYGATTNTAVPAGISGLGNALGIYNGIQQGGVAGYGGAAVNAAQLAGMGGAGYLAAPLAVYNAVHNYKSGKTGSDAMQGASAGAAVGSIIPGVGTLIGAGVGAAAGAIASAFGGGTDSQEATSAQHYTGAFDKLNPNDQQQVAAMQTPAQNVQYLQGLMNAHAAGAGAQSDIQAAFGKNNVAGFTTGMTTTINQALASGKLPPNATPAQIYSQVVQPWLASKAGGQKSGNDIKGNATSTAEADAITNMIGQWQSGALSSKTAVGVKGQTVNMPAWAGGSAQTSPRPGSPAPLPPSAAPGYTPPPSPTSGLAQFRPSRRRIR